MFAEPAHTHTPHTTSLSLSLSLTHTHTHICLRNAQEEKETNEQQSTIEQPIAQNWKLKCAYMLASVSYVCRQDIS